MMLLNLQQVIHLMRHPTKGISTTSISTKGSRGGSSSSSSGMSFFFPTSTKHRFCFSGHEAVEWMLRDHNYFLLFEQDDNAINETKISIDDNEERQKDKMNNVLMLATKLLKEGYISFVCCKKSTKDKSSTNEDDNEENETEHFVDSETVFYKFNQRLKLIIVGGGFAGSKLATTLQKEYDLVLVDVKDRFYCMLSYPVLAVHPEHYSKIQSKHNHYLPHARIIRGKMIDFHCFNNNNNNFEKDVNEINRQKRESNEQLVFIQPTNESGNDDLEQSVIQESFDYLVIATGSRYNVLPFIPSQKENLVNNENNEENNNNNNNENDENDENENTQLEKELPNDNSNTQKIPNNNVINDNVVDVTYLSSVMNGFKSLSNAKHVTVIGGGPTGVEVVGEIAKRFPEKKVLLIHSQDLLLHRMSSNIHQRAMRYFQDRNEFPNLEILFETKVTQVTEINNNNNYNNNNNKYGRKLKLKIISKTNNNNNNNFTNDTTNEKEEGDKNNVIETDIIYACVGFTPVSSFMKQSYHQHRIDDRGAIKVNSQLRINDLPNVFAIGDVNNVKEEKLAQNAELQADITAKNLKSIANGENENRLKNYEPGIRVMIISFGPQNAVIVRNGKVLMHGKLASKSKVLVEKKTMARL